jgi:hypothetical protein
MSALLEANQVLHTAFVELDQSFFAEFVEGVQYLQLMFIKTQKDRCAESAMMMLSEAAKIERQNKSESLRASPLD